MKLEGTTIGQIRIDKLVGEGGMGAVYRGYDLRLERAVAVKTLHDRYLDDPVGRARFLREAQILSRLDHPGICKVYGIVRHENADLLVLEWLEGSSLGDVIPDAPFERLLDLAIEMAEALAVAHRQQIVHRDLKPDNVIVTRDGHVKVLDFGIARSAEPDMSPSRELQDEESFFFDDSDLDSTWSGGGGRRVRKAPDESPDQGPGTLPPRLTVAGNTMGTIAYMSPEQVGGLPLGVASDAYSFGILLQEMFTGRRAYDRVEPLQLMSLVVVGKTRPLGDLDPALLELIRSLQALDEADRPSLSEVADALRRLRREPEIRRRRALRRATVGTIVASLLLGIAAVVHGRLEAARSAAEARELSQIAAEAEWLMRAEHLAPPHDLRPARDTVLDLMNELEERSADLDQGGRAAGNLALGRAALALDDVDSAVEYLSRAWEAGLRDGEVAASYGLALAEKIRRRLIQADRERNEAERRRLRQEAAESVQTARLLLGRAESAEGVEPARALLAEAQLAFLHEDWRGEWDRAIDDATQASEQDAWFFEGDVLAARILQRRMHLRVHQEADESGAAEDLARAQELLDQAASVGRSDPAVQLTRCSLVYDAFVLSLYSTSPDLDVDARAGVEACRRALALDGEDPRGYLFTALLQARLAETLEEPERDEMLEASIESAGRAVELDPGSSESWHALAMGNMVRADYRTMRGGDPEPSLVATIEACRRGLELAPRDIELLNLLGNAEGLRAEIAWARGESPLPATEAAAAAYREAIRLGEADPRIALSYPKSNLAIQLEVAVRWQAYEPGQDPRPMALEGVELARDLVASDEKNGHAWSALASLTSHLAAWHLRRSEADQAQPWAEEALEASEATERWRDDSYALEASAYARTVAARLAAARGDQDEARRYLEGALSTSAELVEDDPELVLGWVRRMHVLLAASELASGPDEARRRAREAVAVGERLVEDDPQHVPARRALAEARGRLEGL